MASLHPHRTEPLSRGVALAHPGESLASYDHLRRRFFIGPMPEKDASKDASQTNIDSSNRKVTDQISSWLHSRARGSDGDDESSTSFLQNHAYHRFLHRGGRKEEWGQQAEADERQNIWDRWQESEWGGSMRHRKKDAGTTTQRWVGGSFEIGNVLGVNILDSPPASLLQVNQTCPDVQTDGPSTIEPPSTVSGQSFATAKTEVSPGAVLNSQASLSPSPSPSSEPSSSTGLIAGLVPEYRSTNDINVAPPGGSQRPTILKGKKSSAHINTNKRKTSFFIGGRITTPADLDSQSAPVGLDKGKGRSFDHTNEGTSSSLQLQNDVNDIPAPPAAVLARSGSDVDETSAEVTLDETPLPQQSQSQRGNIILRDRMLVRVSYTKSESILRHFDEVQNRMTPNLRYEDWAEFLVVWRGERLEIYEDYTLPGKEHIIGHKHLAFIIPLKSQRTHSSLYSFTDFTFCISCPPTPVHNNQSKARALFDRAPEGTNVFVFKTKCRTRGMDWCWQLWRHLGGKIPASIELRCPAIGTRVDLDIPVVDADNIDKAYHMFSRRNIIDIVRKSLGSSCGSHEVASRDWKHVVEREIAAGTTLELAWNLGAKLDWVWKEEDVMCQPRPWAVLCGLAMQQGTKPAHLELRLGQHYPATIHLPDGTKVHEPPCVEGYLDRIKSSSQTKQHIYLTSHDGHLFALWPSNSHAPVPPNVHLSRALSSHHNESLEYTRALREAEVARGAAQIAAAFEAFDLRNIREIRRTTHENIVDDASTHATANVAGGSVGNQDILNRDEDDIGGAEGLVQARDKNELRVRRCFEIVMISGRVIRFETYSCQTSQEWVDRLRALVEYWAQRHHVDARDEMDVSYSTRHRPPVTPRITKHAFCNGKESPTTPIVDAEFIPELSSLYHWCTLDNCRSILKSGRVFTRKGLQGQYKLVQLFLVAGRLLQYQVSRNSFLRHKSREINLLDSYVCSGYLAALALWPSEYNPETPNLARRYFDGFEADDPEEDTLFAIWYRKSRDRPTDNVPSLSAKHKVVVFRTRSRVERDTWCWALGCEIEKLVRANKEREAKLRDAGGLVEID
ncbi:hypothetical protein DEU56DRAFT_777628 [Suillus clintonianus]|uniref:uncharacterized protein n=1 Tax=Suillus clintonianus TaxID=1904413 RepID=UPI001B8758AE|nr:uncharacterized protein DEU56DRAFT_777628 [Suillus clintonianus]KAG2151386.1 hypothetical protein DEU56DRAFT_777628 [Suillus clintonianus]